MVEIKSTSREFTEVEQYLMTIAPNIHSIKDVTDGEKITVAGYMEFNDIKEDTGDVAEILSIITPENEVYSCQSKTFKRALKDIANIMHGNQFTVVKISGKTKAGRDYVNCILDVDSVK